MLKSQYLLPTYIAVCLKFQECHFLLLLQVAIGFLVGKYQDALESQ